MAFAGLHYSNPPAMAHQNVLPGLSSLGLAQHLTLRKAGKAVEFYYRIYYTTWWVDKLAHFLFPATASHSTPTSPHPVESSPKGQMKKT